MVLLLTLQHICEVDRSVAHQMKAKVFPEEDYLVRCCFHAPCSRDCANMVHIMFQAMEGNRFDDNKFDPNKQLPSDASLRLHVIKLLTSIDYTLWVDLNRLH